MNKDVIEKNYTILHCHSYISNAVTNIDSVSSPIQLIDRAHELGMTSMALSEHGSVMMWCKKKLHMEELGMKYIHAEEFYLTETLCEKIRDNYHCLLIAKNYDGVLELNKLSSKSFNREDNSFYYVPRITIEDVKNTSDNIIVSTACFSGLINKAPNEIKEDFIKWMALHKHRCYLEIQPHLSQEQIKYNQYLYKLSQQYNIPLLMCTDTHALNKTHTKGRTILQKAKNIHFEGEDEFYLEMLSYDEVVNLCKAQNALPLEVYLEAIEETNRVAAIIEPFELDYSYKYPHLWGDNSEQVLRDKIAEGLKRHKINTFPNYQEYLDRIEYEMKAYIHNGAIDFMLLMEDIVSWCKTQDIQIGYGRGSVNGSVIAYLLGITEMDSIKHKLNFERFMSTERVSLSDIDTDLPPSRIDEVKEYVFNKHGLYCSDIITFNTIALKGAIRDVGRALEIPFDEVGKICDSVETQEKELRKQYPELFEYVDIVNGCVVSVGNHPSGMVVAPCSIDDHMGLFTTSTDTVPISQINMKEVDLQNYVKLDLLKLNTIELIDKTCKLAGIECLTPDNIDVSDINVWNSIRDDTTAIFQWESGSAQEYIKKLLSDKTISRLKEVQPDIDYITLLSIGNGAIRPAGASYRDELANGIIKKTGNKVIDDFMKPTFGYLIFQCQIIQFLHECCGYTMGEADVVRRHFSKKLGTDKDIPQIKDGFIKTMAEKYNMPKEEADKIIIDFLQVIIDASNYLFSLNHSQPYSYEGYVCGWLRYYYPLQFLTVALNINKNDEEKTAALIAYAHKEKIEIRSPKFRRSKADYFCDVKDNCIYRGLGSIKHMSADAAEDLYSIRDMQFKNFIEVLYAIQELPHKPDSRQLNILIKIGYFEEFGKANALLKGVEIFNKYYKCATIKLDKWIEEGYSIEQLAPYAEKITEKMARGLNNKEIILSILRTSRMPKTSAFDMCRWQIELLGYTTITDTKASIYDYIVTNIKETKYGTVYAKIYNLHYGVEREYRCNRKYWSGLPLVVGDAIRVILEEKDKMKKNEADNWVKTGEKITEIKCWKMLDNGTLV